MSYANSKLTIFVVPQVFSNPIQNDVSTNRLVNISAKSQKSSFNCRAPNPKTKSYKKTASDSPIGANLPPIIATSLNLQKLRPSSKNSRGETCNSTINCQFHRKLRNGREFWCDHDHTTLCKDPHCPSQPVIRNHSLNLKILSKKLTTELTLLAYSLIFSISLPQIHYSRARRKIIPPLSST